MTGPGDAIEVPASQDVVVEVRFRVAGVEHALRMEAPAAVAEDMVKSLNLAVLTTIQRALPRPCAPSGSITR